MGSDALSSNSVNVTGKANPNFINLQILQLSDFHDAIEKTTTNIGAAAMATVFRGDRIDLKNTLTVSSGDNIGAAPVISTEFEVLPAFEALNLMGFDYLTFGNHEHDRNLAHLRKIIDASDCAGLSPATTHWFHFKAVPKCQRVRRDLAPDE